MLNQYDPFSFDLDCRHCGRTHHEDDIDALGNCELCAEIVAANAAEDAAWDAQFEADEAAIAAQWAAA